MWHLLPTSTILLPPLFSLIHVSELVMFAVGNYRLVRAVEDTLHLSLLPLRDDCYDGAEANRAKLVIALCPSKLGNVH